MCSKPAEVHKINRKLHKIDMGNMNGNQHITVTAGERPPIKRPGPICPLNLPLLVVLKYTPELCRLAIQYG